MLLKKNILLSDILNFSSIDDAREYIIEKEINSVLRESHDEQFAWLEKMINVPLRKDLTIWPDFIEVTERRNLFVHCNSIVSSQYLTVCKKHGVNLGEDVQAGQSLAVSIKYFKKAFDYIFEIGVKLAQVLWRKLNPLDIEEADDALNDICYQLIDKKDYSLAINLLEFGITILKKHFSQETKSYMIINLAQAYKWNNEPEKLNSILNSTDWSIYNNRFQLAVAVLKDDFDMACKYMEQIGDCGDMEPLHYIRWPIFKEFRKDQRFIDTYEKIFNKPFESEVLEGFKMMDERHDDNVRIPANLEVVEVLKGLQELASITYFKNLIK